MNPLVEKLLRVREPLAWVLTALGAGFTIIFLVDFNGALIQGEDTVFEVARRSSGSSLGLTIMLAMVAAVWWCRLQAPVVTRSTVIAKVAAIVVAVGAACDLILAILACVHAPRSNPWCGPGVHRVPHGGGGQGAGDHCPHRGGITTQPR